MELFHRVSRSLLSLRSWTNSKVFAAVSPQGTYQPCRTMLSLVDAQLFVRQSQFAGD